MQGLQHSLQPAAALSAVLALGVKMLQPSSKPCKLCTILQPLRHTQPQDGTLSVSVAAVGFIRLSSSPLTFSHFLGLLLYAANRSELHTGAGPFSQIFKIKKD